MLGLMLAPDTRILVVDDGDAIRVMMRRLLGNLGYKDVRLADTVDMGLQAFAEQGSEVVFLDCAIADRKGIDFARKALADRPDTEVIILTAYPFNHPDVTELIAHGARHYLPKPIQTHQLSAVLERVAADFGEDDEEDDEVASVDASYV